MLIRARLVLPVAAPPIADGAVHVVRQHIVAVGDWRALGRGHRARTVDLGDSLLLPGLINAHCHLDYTRMGGLIPPPKSFSRWIQILVAMKNAWSDDDFAASWRTGAEMLLRTGTTTVADIEARPDLLPEAWQATPLRVISYRELIALKEDAAARLILQKTLQQWAALTGRRRTLSGLSPHAPYTTTGPLLRLAQEAASRRGWHLSTHLAESQEEFDMFMRGRGVMYDWLGPQRNSDDCGRGSPVRHLEQCGYLSDKLLAVHVNVLASGDAEILGRRGVHIAHCPLSHAYFGHPPFQDEVLARAGVNLCLGTDSLATVRTNGKQPGELNMFSEMQAFAARRPGIDPLNVLRMATMNGARALGLAGQIGELAAGAKADLIAIPFTGTTADANAAALHHRGPVLASMINGKWVIPPTK